MKTRSCDRGFLPDIRRMMQPVILFSSMLAAMIPAGADPISKFEVSPGKSAPPAAEAKYISESPLPKGWPEPGPYNQVTRKNYPAYRAAVTAESSPNGGFWRLFKHIGRNNIPMTSPVEMKLDAEDASGMKMEHMAFLYQSPDVGKAGADGKDIEVRDLPALSTLSFTWQGARDKDSVARARKAIDGELAKQNLKASGYRLLGYNSPFISRSKQTYELQALLVKN
jgi:hypothetical protein